MDPQFVRPNQPQTDPGPASEPDFDAVAANQPEHQDFTGEIKPVPADQVYPTASSASTGALSRSSPPPPPKPLPAFMRPTSSMGQLPNQPPLTQIKRPSRFGGKKIWAFIILFVIILIGGAAYFSLALSNSPERLWSKSLSNTAKSYDKLVEYAAKNKNIKGLSIKGSFKSSGGLAADGSFEGSSSDDNGQYKGTLSATGLKMNVELKTVKSPGNSPDIYFKVDGLQGLGTLLGGTDQEIVDSLNALNGQWYFIDHTFFDQFAQGSNSSTQITNEDITSILKATGDASKEFIFTSDSKKAALTLKEKIGKDKQEGLDTYHYKAGVNKQNLKNYVDKLCNNLKSSKLNKFFGGDQSSTEQAIDCQGLKADVDKVSDSKTVDVWVDTKTKLLHKIRFSFSDKMPVGDVEVQPPEDSTGSSKVTNEGYFEVLQSYRGGDEFPIGLNYQSVSNQGELGKSTTTASLNLKINMKTNSFDFSGQAVDDQLGDKTTFTYNLNITPNTAEVKVDKPAGAKNLIELFNALMGDVSVKANDTERKTDINALHAHIEAYFAENGRYPTLAEFNNEGWRQANMKGLDSEALKDPASSSSALAATPAAKVYAYQASPAGCDDVKTDCTTYTLTATLDGGGTYVKQSLN